MILANSVDFRLNILFLRGLMIRRVYAKELLKLLRGLDCRMNLIRFHSIPGVDLEGADMDTMTRFRDLPDIARAFHYHPCFAG